MKVQRPRLLAATTVLAVATACLVVVLAPGQHRLQANSTPTAGTATGGAPRPAPPSGPATSAPGGHGRRQGIHLAEATHGPGHRAPGSRGPAASSTPGTAGGTRPGASPSASPATSPARSSRVPSESDLQAALLAPAQIGPGFTEQPAGDGISEGRLTSACSAVGQGTSPTETAIAAFATNLGTEQATDVTEELLQLTPSQAEAQLNQFATVARACPTFTIQVPSSLGTLQVQAGISQVAFSGIGDQDAAIRVAGNLIDGDEDIQVYADIFAVRHGGTIILVVNAALNLDTSLTASVVREAYARVAAAW